MESAIVELYKKRTGMKYRECRRLYGPSLSNDDDDGDLVRAIFGSRRGVEWWRIER